MDLSSYLSIYLSKTRDSELGMVRPWPEFLNESLGMCKALRCAARRGVLELMDGMAQASWLCFGWSKMVYIRRKFRSETSDNMDSWKAEVRRVRREKIRRKKMQMREKVGKSRFTVFFQWFVAPEGRKVGSLKRRVRTQLARWEM